MVLLSQKRKTGNTPTGPKKVKSKILLGECCFFALMRVAFKSMGAQSAFRESWHFENLYMGVWVVCRQFLSHHIMSYTG